MDFTRQFSFFRSRLATCPFSFLLSISSGLDWDLEPPGSISFGLVGLTSGFPFVILFGLF